MPGTGAGSIRKLYLTSVFLNHIFEKKKLWKLDMNKSVIKL